MANEIIVLGGGFAGFWAALAAKRVVANTAAVKLVSRSPVLEMRPRLYEARPADLGVDLGPYLDAAAVEFIAGEGAGLDDDVLLLSDGRRIEFGRLVVATGSVMERPPVPGAESAWSCDTMAEAIAFDARLSEIARQAHGHIAVVGAGFTGIELALELRDRITAHRGDGEALRVTLIDRADTVGKELGPGPRPEIEAALAAAGVEVRVGETVVGLAADRIETNDGAIDCDAVVLATGLRAAGFVERIRGDRDHLGRLKVSEDLRAPEAPKVFVAGDAASADTGDGHLTLQSCQHALQSGRFAGENAARDLLGRPTIPYRQPRYVTCLDLGRWGAVRTDGWDRRIMMTGAEAKAIKKMINRQIIYPPPSVDGAALLAFSSTDPAKQRR